MTGRAHTFAFAALPILAVLILPVGPLPGWHGISARLLEGGLILALLCLGGKWARLVLVPALALLAAVKLADLATRAALGRVFNPASDLSLADAAIRLIAGIWGGLAAGAILLAVLLLYAGLVFALIRGCTIWSGGNWTRRQKSGAALFCGLALLPAAMGSQPLSGNVQYAFARAELAWQTASDLRDLRKAASRDAFFPQGAALSAIDRDMLVIFVESYGRSSFDSPFYSRHLTTLRQAEARLRQAGLAMRSGFLGSPVQGGQSWLAHATFANGLRIKDQAAYRAVLASGRQSLFHHARRAGFQTIAVMPGITRPWPEARTMGFDRVLAAADLGYRGKPFDWVTMPDQFTLAAMDRLLPHDQQRSKRLIQIAMISSHAPWTPVPRLLPWDQIADGTEFNAMTEAGIPPETLWRDREQVRHAYRDALDYALSTVTGYVLRHAKEAPLVLILGDHQAAPGIALDGNSDVPLHVIGPSALVERAAGWGFGRGLVPPHDHTAIPMEAMRDLILGGFSPPLPVCHRPEQAATENC